MVDTQSAGFGDCLTHSLRDTRHQEQFHAVNSPWDALGARVRQLPTFLMMLHEDLSPYCHLVIPSICAR